MQEVFEKIIEKLEEKSDYEPIDYDSCDISCSDEQKFIATDEAIDIVKQTAEEYNNGWIPVSERLPEESLNSVIGWDAYRERCCFVQYLGGRFILGDDTESVNITAWQPVIGPYQPKFVQKCVNPSSQEEIEALKKKIRSIPVVTYPTNADRIRSLSDEELAVFLCKVKADYQWAEHEFPSESECGEWKEWLQSEVDG